MLINPKRVETLKAPITRPPPPKILKTIVSISTISDISILLCVSQMFQIVFFCIRDFDHFTATIKKCKNSCRNDIFMIVSNLNLK